ncbi:MAG: hypothetical protein EXS42_06290 [Lacunisphaera sp.]|nr:hypothetical protein [Lacunisphaera sp.]
MKNLLLFFAGLGLLATGSRAENINLGGGKSLHFILPGAWISTDTSAPSPEVSQVGKNLRYVPKGGSSDAVLLTVLLVPDNRYSDRENLRMLVADATQQFAPESVEGKAFIKELRTATVTGFTATFTDIDLVDKPPVNDDYKTMTACFIYLGEKVMVFATIFSDDPAGPAFAEGLRLLKSLTLATPKGSI